jgi:hypothetical protein
MNIKIEHINSKVYLPALLSSFSEKPVKTERFIAFTKVIRSAMCIMW